MKLDSVIEAALRAGGLPSDITQQRTLSSGHGATVEALTLSTGDVVVVKTGPRSIAAMLRGEEAGLRALAETETVLVPQPIVFHETADGAALVTTYIESGRASADAWRQFGEQLAALHHCDVGRQYGFEVDNHLGATPQPNGWTEDWVEFNRVHRFQHQLRLARDRHLRRDEAARIETLCDRLGEILPHKLKPSLLHGDLWSGNALPAASGRIAVIDPATYIGDCWADIAMMRLFGGFPEECFDAYSAIVPQREGVEMRLAVYQLYHVLNHVNLFGRSYVNRAMALLDALGL